MGHIHQTGIAEVPRAVAFGYVDDHTHVPEWMFGVSKFDAIGELDHGLGARYAVAMNLGPKTLKSVVEVVEWEQDRVIALETVDGIQHSSRWQFDDADGGTRLTVDFRYGFPGGLAGKALAVAVEPVVATAVRATDAALRQKVVEYHAGEV